jgi:hypothetical protein
MGKLFFRIDDTDQAFVSFLVSCNRLLKVECQNQALGTWYLDLKNEVMSRRSRIAILKMLFLAVLGCCDRPQNLISGW